VRANFRANNKPAEIGGSPGAACSSRKCTITALVQGQLNVLIEFIACEWYSSLP
jgi:hypothetical protein